MQMNPNKFIAENVLLRFTTGAMENGDIKTLATLMIRHEGGGHETEVMRGLPSQFASLAVSTFWVLLQDILPEELR
jgi:hypothetical protein